MLWLKGASGFILTFGLLCISLKRCLTKLLFLCWEKQKELIYMLTSLFCIWTSSHLKCLSGFLYLRLVCLNCLKTWFHALCFFKPIFGLIFYSVWCYTLTVYPEWTEEETFLLCCCFFILFVCFWQIHGIVIRIFTGIFRCLLFVLLPDVDWCGWISLLNIYWITVVKSVKLCKE